MPTSFFESRDRRMRCPYGTEAFQNAACLTAGRQTYRPEIFIWGRPNRNLEAQVGKALFVYRNNCACMSMITNTTERCVINQLHMFVRCVPRKSSKQFYHSSWSTCVMERSRSSYGNDRIAKSVCLRSMINRDSHHATLEIIKHDF